MTTTAEYLDQGWTACLVGMAGHPYGPDAHSAFNARFHDTVELQNTEHPRWLADNAGSISGLAQQIGGVAAILAGWSLITGANINAAADAVSASQDKPTQLCG